MHKAVTASLLLALISPVLRAQFTGGMLHPGIDAPGQPFSYFARPTDVIGSLYAPVAAEVTPEGYIYTGSGELMFFTGNPPERVVQRVRTLHKGYLPVVEYSVSREGVRHSFQLFGADLGGPLAGLPVCFVQVTLSNETNQLRTAFFTTAYRFRPTTEHLQMVQHRFSQRFDLLPDRLIKGQTVFNPNWEYAFSDEAVVRDGRLLYTFPPDPHQVSLALGDFGLRSYRLFSGELGTNDTHMNLLPEMPMGAVMYRAVLPPGASHQLVFKMPIIPLPLNSPEARLVHQASYSEVFRRTVADWESMLGRPPLSLPEEKVQNFLLANTITSLLAVDKVGDKYSQVINKFQYHGYGGCGSTDFPMLALDYMNQFDVTRKLMKSCLGMSSPDGRMGSGDMYWETTAEVLWLWGRHYALTRDEEFLQSIYPTVVRAVDWIEYITAEDPLGLLPVSSMPDDEQVKNVHITGQSLWTLAGLRQARLLAEAMGKPEDAQHFDAVYNRYRQSFEKQLALQTAQTGGYMPPALDRTLAGNDWYNMATLFPEPLFDPFDPRVTATIRETRARYAEGILTYVDPHAVARKNGADVFNYPPALHYWQSDLNAQAALVRGSAQDQEDAVKDLYALLLHTNATHSTQEWGSFPWGTREITLAYPDNIQPDQVTSGRIMLLIRNMLVREYNNDLCLLSAISPEWLRPGRRIVLTNEPTTFGPISATVNATASGWDLTISPVYRQKPEHLVIRVPWFYEVRSAEADGRPVTAQNGAWVLPPSTRALRITGQIKPAAQALNFEGAVEQYKQEYARRYERFLQTGSSTE